ncbi:MAG TPA: hypothetical protein VEX66_12940 [Microlunatus sp.]|nr:hypothetical protein [Microlunatus sp.]
MAVVNAGDPVLGTVQQEGSEHYPGHRDRRSRRLPGHPLLGLADRPGRPSPGLPGRHRDDRVFGIPMFLLLNTGQAELVGSDAR